MSFSKNIFFNFSGESDSDTTSSSSDSSDSDLELIQALRYIVKKRKNAANKTTNEDEPNSKSSRREYEYFDIIVPKFSDRKFLAEFRLTRETVKLLEETFEQSYYYTQYKKQSKPLPISLECLFNKFFFIFRIS